MKRCEGAVSALFPKKAIDSVNISGADTGPWQSDEQWAVAAVSE